MYSFKSFISNCSTQEQLPLLQHSSLGCYHFTVAAATHTTQHSTQLSAPLSSTLYLPEAAAGSFSNNFNNKIQVNNKAGNYAVHVLVYFPNITLRIPMTQNGNNTSSKLQKSNSLLSPTKSIVARGNKW